jgi:hypothetical protein
MPKPPEHTDETTPKAPLKGIGQDRKASAMPLAKSPPGSASELSSDELDKVTGGRDPASGLPTGKRMHKPFTLK